MGQDIRKMMKDYQPGTSKLSKGHEARFETRLKAASSEKPQLGIYMWMKIAAVVVAVFAVGSFVYFSINDGVESNAITTTENNSNTEEIADTAITLGDLSPDLKKIESYYTTGINVQLASLHVTDDNKELVDGYLTRLAELDEAYKKLNKELNEVGPTEVTITALIDNLQLRLELLFKLKNKLKELKNQNNEDYNII
jgi:hypothetical protein